MFKTLIPDRFRNKVYRTKTALIASSMMVPKHNNVLAHLKKPGWRRPLLIPGSNIVTDAGDLHYAQEIVGEGTTNAFGVLVLGTGGNAPAKTNNFSDITEIAASEKAHDSGYPTRNDADGDNTGSGADVVSYLTSYTKGDFNATGITDGCITNATPGASEPVQTHFEFGASFDKTANDTLKVFTNHTLNGV